MSGCSRDIARGGVRARTCCLCAREFCMHRAAANRTGATVELLKLQQARGEKLQVLAEGHWCSD